MLVQVESFDAFTSWDQIMGLIQHIIALNGRSRDSLEPLPYYPPQKSSKLSKPLNDAIPVLLEPQGQSVLAIVLNKVHLITRAPTD